MKAHIFWSLAEKLLRLLTSVEVYRLFRGAGLQLADPLYTFLCEGEVVPMRKNGCIFPKVFVQYVCHSRTKHKLYLLFLIISEINSKLYRYYRKDCKINKKIIKKQK